LDRKTPQEDGVDEAEDRRVRADSQRQCQHRDNGESWIASERADGVSHVSNTIEKPRPHPHISRLITGEGGIAKRLSGCGGRVLGRFAASLELALFHGAMKLHLFGEVVFELLTPQ
jgi:hypothetical protein